MTDQKQQNQFSHVNLWEASNHRFKNKVKIEDKLPIDVHNTFTNEKEYFMNC